MRVAINGAGIAGLTLASCLSKAGIEFVVIEKTPAVREEGYMIDFFGAGYDAAEKMGLLPELEHIHYPIDGLIFINEQGGEKFSVPYATFKKLMNNRHFNFLRGDLERVLFAALPSDSDIRFNTTITRIEQAQSGVQILLSDGSRIDADLLVGAGGIHSPVRSLVFGDELRYSHYLNCNTAAFIIDDPSPDLVSEFRQAFYTLTVPGRQVGVYPIWGGRLATFFVNRSVVRPDHVLRSSPAEELHRVYGSIGWVVPELLRHLKSRQNIYFDEVSQISMPSWSSGRVVLLGDAAYCPSLAAGHGASLAMAGGYVLAEELSVAPNRIPDALQNYERRLRPSVEKKQKVGRRMVSWFLPKNRLQIALRDFGTRLAATPFGGALATPFTGKDSIFAA
jgi:2-polyprenyl-6-methoxyphenol hydroxylase-like FAD-dependent oxidoreductase